MPAMVENTRVTIWREKIKTHLGKAFLKHHLKIANDILCVEQGLKPSVLLDYGVANPQSLKEFLTALRNAHIIAQDLTVVCVEDDLFVCDVDAVMNSLTDTFTRVALVDVTHGHAAPQPVSSQDTILRDHVRAIESQLVGDIEPRTRRVGAPPPCPRDSAGELKRNPGSPCWTGDNCATQRHTGTCVVKFDLPANVNRTTLFGLFLGYPVVYWYRTEGDGQPVGGRTCLDMVPLCVVTVTALRNSNDTQQKDARPHGVCSFSLPEGLVQHYQHHIDTWCKNMTDLFNKQRMFVSIDISRETVTLPTVGLWNRLLNIFNKILMYRD